jgi:hypothetical protein
MKKFDIPEIKILDFEVADVVTTSEEEPSVMGSSCIS